MSTVKISELPVLSSADAADEFVVVDDSAGVTKKITFDALATDVRTEAEPLTASTVTASGLVTASSGITFGADTLDDYEEGTWTPLDGDGNTMSSLNAEIPTYRRVGNLVVLSADITFRSGISTNNFRLQGLPFASPNDVRIAGAVAFLTGTSTIFGWHGSTSFVDAFEIPGSTKPDLSNVRVMFTLSYFTS